MKAKLFNLTLEAQDVELPDEYDILHKMTPEEVIVDIAKKRGLNKRAQEVVLFVGWNGDGKVCGISELAKGTSNGAIGTMKEAFQSALMCNAVSFATLHNHPSGEAIPSQGDIERCKKLTEVGKFLGITFVEDMVIDWDGNSDSVMRAMLKQKYEKDNGI